LCSRVVIHLLCLVPGHHIAPKVASPMWLAPRNAKVVIRQRYAIHIIIRIIIIIVIEAEALVVAAGAAVVVVVVVVVVAVAADLAMQGANE
jgi:hypothetical protein